MKTLCVVTLFAVLLAGCSTAKDYRLHYTEVGRNNWTLLGDWHTEGASCFKMRQLFYHRPSITSRYPNVSVPMILSNPKCFGTSYNNVYDYTEKVSRAKINCDTGVLTIDGRMPRQRYSLMAKQALCNSPKLVAQKKEVLQKREAQAEQELAKSQEIKKQQRLSACDSFGFKRDTEAHAQCAMRIYLEDQKQSVAAGSSDSEADRAALEAQIARQEAVQEAILREQERVRNWEQSMKLIEIGTGIATGSLGGRSTPKMQSHTYTINGQIINCTTTGSSTDCY